MRRRIAVAAAAGLALAASHILTGCAKPAQAQGSVDASPAARAVPTASNAMVVRGEYLARAADCVACHTVPGGASYAGGVPFKLPFGTLYSTNITPDRQTGIGRWSDDDFVRALHEGIAPGGRHLYPAFPYTSYTAITRPDALAIKAYLFSLKPLHAPALPDHLSFPFNQRWLMAFWNVLFARGRVYQADANRSADWNRGAYLVNALAHCGECHTPRNLLYGLENGHRLAGAQIEGWRAYNITSDRTYGIGAWSDGAIQQYLAMGHAPGHGSASGSMGEAVENSFRYLSSHDIHSITVYLRTVRAEQGPAGTPIDPHPPAVRSTLYAPAPGEASAALGRRIFQGACSSCHAYNGQGLENDYAALAGSPAVNDPSGMNMTQVILHGATMQTNHGKVFMPAFGGAYTDAEVAAVANYAIAHFGGKHARITPGEVRKRRSSE